MFQKVLQESLKGIGESETIVGSVAGRNENLIEAESCFVSINKPFEFLSN